MFNIILVSAAFLGVFLGMLFGEEVHDSKPGTVIGILLCVCALVLLGWQVYLWDVSWVPVRAAICILVFIAECCTASSLRIFKAKQEEPYRTVLALFLILDAAFTFVAIFGF
jgi:hypothetical protein